MKLENITEASLDERLKVRDKFVMIDFWASWCGPCKSLAPILEDLKDGYGQSVDMFTASIEDEPGLAASHMVMSVPTLVFYRNGERLKTVSGGKTRVQMIELFEELKTV